MGLGPVGFDLDMTLIDSRPAIMAAFEAMSRDMSASIDLDAVNGRLGVKLEDELAYWFPPEGIAEADELFTHVHGQEKAEVLRSIRAAVYVGDTPPDITAGISAGVRAVGVATGSFTAADLRRAGAQPVLATLEAFPAWYQELNDLHLRGYRGGARPRRGSSTSDRQRSGLGYPS